MQEQAGMMTCLQEPQCTPGMQRSEMECSMAGCKRNAVRIHTSTRDGGAVIRIGSHLSLDTRTDTSRNKEATQSQWPTAWSSLDTVRAWVTEPRIVARVECFACRQTIPRRVRVLRINGTTSKAMRAAIN